MGIDTTTMVGAYVQTKNKVEQATEKKVTYKNKNTGKIFKNPVKFDPETGDPVSKIVEDVPKEVIYKGWYDLMKALDYPGYLDEEAFWQPAYMAKPKGYTVIISNFGDEISSIDSGRGEEAIVEINPSLIEDCISKFKEKYAKELKALDEFYEEVEVKFGVITYSH